MKRYVKDPDSVEDYEIDWSTFLDGDTIDTSTWTPGSGISVASSSNTTTVATARVSGGTAGQEHSAVNRITTTNGRTGEETLYFVVVER